MRSSAFHGSDLSTGVPVSPDLVHFLALLALILSAASLAVKFAALLTLVAPLATLVVTPVALAALPIPLPKAISVAIRVDQPPTRGSIPALPTKSPTVPAAISCPWARVLNTGLAPGIAVMTLPAVSTPLVAKKVA